MALHVAGRTGSCSLDYVSQRHADAAMQGIEGDSSRRTNSPGRCN